MCIVCVRAEESQTEVENGEWGFLVPYLCLIIATAAPGHRHTHRGHNDELLEKTGRSLLGGHALPPLPHSFTSTISSPACCYQVFCSPSPPTAHLSLKFSQAKGDSTKTSCRSFPLAKVVVNNWSIPFLTPLAEVLPKGVWYVKGWPKHTAVSWLVSKCLVSATMHLYSKQPYPHLVDLNVKPWLYLSSDDVCFSIISNGIQLLIFVPWLDNTVMTFMIQCD